MNANFLPSAHDPRPIGIFDSGMGGLTVVRAMEAALPREQLVYLGDTARVPYGTRSPAVVRRYAERCAAYLKTHDVKMIVVACNTASAHALETLRHNTAVPVLGVIEAGADRAAEQAPQGPIAVLGTEGTVLSQAYQHALKRVAPDAQVLAQACPLLVPLCEEGLIDHPATQLLLEDYLAPVIRIKPKVILLGCTHYPVLAPRIAQIVGDKSSLVDSATAMAQQVEALLQKKHLQAPQAQIGQLKLVTTDLNNRALRVAKLFLGRTVDDVQLVDI